MNGQNAVKQDRIDSLWSIAAEYLDGSHESNRLVIEARKLPREYQQRHLALCLAQLEGIELDDFNEWSPFPDYEEDETEV